MSVKILIFYLLDKQKRVLETRDFKAPRVAPWPLWCCSDNPLTSSHPIRVPQSLCLGWRESLPVYHSTFPQPDPDSHIPRTKWPKESCGLLKGVRHSFLPGIISSDLSISLKYLIPTGVSLSSRHSSGLAEAAILTEGTCLPSSFLRPLTSLYRLLPCGNVLIETSQDPAGSGPLTASSCKAPAGFPG